MADAPWHVEVARLLEEAAHAVGTRRYPRTIVALGTAVAYVQRAREEGDKFAAELLRHTVESPKDEATERFA